MNVEKNQQASLDILPLDAHIESASRFVSSYADQLGIAEERCLRLSSAAKEAMHLVKRNVAATMDAERIRVDVFEAEGRLYVEVLNHGVPLSFDEEAENDNTPRFHDISKGLDRFSIENRGREGQTVVLGMRLGEQAAQKSLAFGQPETISTEEESELEVREIKKGEEQKFSQLFFHVYGYNYVNDIVYYPEKIASMIEKGELISMVAVHHSTGKFLAHVGLRKWQDTPPVYEPCLGVTNPSVKSKGLFRKLFQKLMERVDETPMQYCFVDFVTNHEYSQKLVEHYNPAPVALFVGCQSKNYQAKLEKLGIGEDPKETDRYTLLFSIMPKVKHPFGKEIRLPNNLGEMMGAFLRPLNLTWTPAPRFEMLVPGGEYQTHVQPLHNSVLFDLVKPGRDAVENILRDWRRMLKVGYQYAAVDVPLGGRGIGNLQDILLDHGFFVAGFVPDHCSDRLAFRFQTIGHTKLDFDEIRIFSGQGKKLLEVIRENYERNQQL